MGRTTTRIIAATFIAAVLVGAYGCGGGYGGGNSGVYQTPMPHPSPKPTM